MLNFEEEGKLDIDRTVVSYLPEYNASDKQAITLRMLLTHASGIKSTAPTCRPPASTADTSLTTVAA